MINLNTCKPGQKLRSRHGMILIYIGKNIKPWHSAWPHKVEYPDKSYGSRTDDGFVYKNPSSRLSTDHDIVEILD